MLSNLAQGLTPCILIVRIKVAHPKVKVAIATRQPEHTNTTLIYDSPAVALKQIQERVLNEQSHPSFAAGAMSPEASKALERDVGLSPAICAMCFLQTNDLVLTSKPCDKFMALGLLASVAAEVCL